MQLIIEELGGQGDGIAHVNGEKLFVPLALSGERVEVEPDGGRGALLRIIEPSADRCRPLCRHFAQCGGCALQHLHEDAYRSWKREKVITALAARGIEATVAPLVPLQPGSRRRAVLSARKTKKSVMIGYFRRHSHDLVDLEECPVLVPEIVDALPGLRALLRPLLSRKDVARISILSTLGGLDILIDHISPELGMSARSELTSRTADLPLARLTIGDEVFLERDRPFVLLGGVQTVAPPGGFLQASDAAQENMIAHVLSLAGDGGQSVDLFSGMGTFTLPLARRFKVRAVEYDETALASLKQAASAVEGLKPITTMRRDLFREPLSAKELEGFDLALFDPPRAGAAEQAGELAGSNVPAIIAVSCNPASFARDARLLIDGGYSLESVTPYDQFLFSPHVELIGHFTR